jgi:hypothetical protein
MVAVQEEDLMMQRCYAYFSGMAMALFLCIIPRLMVAQVLPVGLQKDFITHITAEQGDTEGGWYPGTANLLFASVHMYGVYQGYSWDDGGKWSFIGPAYDPPVPITALGVQHWGYGARDGLHLYVGLSWPRDAPPESPVLVRREFYPFGPSPEDWARADSGFVRDSARGGVGPITAFYFSGHTPPQPVIAWADSAAVRSGPGGYFWEKAETPSARIRDMDVTPYWYGSDIWASGSLQTGVVSSPYQAVVLRSKDKGATWESFPFTGEKDVHAYAVAVSPGHPDTAWASIEGEVQRTTDGGMSWLHVLQPDTGNVIALATDPMYPSHVYAAADSDFSLYRSTDLGDSWRRIYPQNGYFPKAITCMTVALMDTLPMSRLPRYGLFMGTRGTGVWVYDMLFGPTTAVEAAPLPSHPQLVLYPNPSREAVNVSLRLSTTTAVDVEIHDLLGRPVLRRSFGMLSVGSHILSLQTAALPPGSYLLRIPGMLDRGLGLLRVLR